MHFDGGIWKIERFSLKVMAVSFFFLTFVAMKHRSYGFAPIKRNWCFCADLFHVEPIKLMTMKHHLVAIPRRYGILFHLLAGMCICILANYSNSTLDLLPIKFFLEEINRGWQRAARISSRIWRLQVMAGARRWARWIPTPIWYGRRRAASSSTTSPIVSGNSPNCMRWRISNPFILKQGWRKEENNKNERVCHKSMTHPLYYCDNCNLSKLYFCPIL